MKVIGAGLPRSATTTQMFALESLGLGPCYHMRDLLADLEAGLPLWEAAAEGKADWERVFGEARSSADWPSARFYAELIEYYPRAKVVLSARSGPEWARSMHETVWGVYHGDSVLHHMCEARGVVDPLWRRYMDLMIHITWDEKTGALPGETGTEEGLAAAMERWHEQVIATVPADRLLVWNPSDGWEPLCEFLQVDVPADPMPRLNDTPAFREGMIGGAIGAVNEWWDARERPAGGLHGAPAPVSAAAETNGQQGPFPSISQAQTAEA